MKYQANLPQEPDGPLWDQDGRKYVRIGPKNASAPNECGLWELSAPKGEKPYYTWAELLAKVEYLRDDAQAIENLQNAKIGGLYWAEGKEGNSISDVKGVAHHHHLKDPYTWTTPHTTLEKYSAKSPKWNAPSPTP